VGWKEAIDEASRQWLASHIRSKKLTAGPVVSSAFTTLFNIRIFAADQQSLA